MMLLLMRFFRENRIVGVSGGFFKNEKAESREIFTSNNQNALNASDLESARASLSFAIGASLEVSGRVVKLVKHP
jgi:hypothetical protein